jgi:hypothetical protein
MFCGYSIQEAAVIVDAEDGHHGAFFIRQVCTLNPFLSRRS